MIGEATAFKYQKLVPSAQETEFTESSFPDFLEPVDTEISMAPAGSIHLHGPKRCGVCENVASQMVGQLEKALAQTAIGGGCAVLCGFVAELAQLCMVACEVVGYKEFVNVLQEVQGYIDPVYFCSKVRMCRVTEGGSITDGALDVPKQVKAGHPFAIDAKFNVGKPLGAGELIIMLQPPRGGPLGNANFEDGFKAGSNDIKINVNLADPQPNPSRPGPPPQPLPRGQWIAKVMICQLSCGSPYKESEVYRTFAAPFELMNTTTVDY